MLLTSEVSGEGYGSGHKWKKLYMPASCQFSEIGLQFQAYICVVCGARFKHFPRDGTVFNAIKYTGVSNWCPDPNVLRPQPCTLPGPGVNLMDSGVMNTAHSTIAENFAVEPITESTLEQTNEQESETKINAKVNDD